jgi:aerotaxis receptor
MRTNQPISNREKRIPPGATLVSKTDLKGLIVYASKDFCDVSEYEKSAMVGEPHNIVRHPDMPQAAFADLWARIKCGRPWRGLVKNRAKSGDHYWVEAQVAPQIQSGRLSGFMSVRRAPTRLQIDEAIKLYTQMNAQGKDAKRALWIRLDHFFKSIPLSLRLTALVAGIISAAAIPLFLFILDFPVAVTIGSGIALNAIFLPLLLWTRRALLKQISQANSILKEMGGGDFTQSIDIRDDTETGRLLEYLQIMNTNISGLIFQMTENGREMNGGAKSLADSSQNLSSAIEQISNQSSTISTTSSQVAQNLQTVSCAVEEMSSAINEVAREASESANISKEAASTAERAQNQIRDLGVSAKNINHVLEIIDNISEQINFLALNASIEAAGAGAAGKTFGIVAAKVKELAQQTANSSVDIKNQIQEIQNQADEAIQSIDCITAIVNRVNEGNASIASSVEQQSMTTQEIAKNVSQISQATTEITQNISGISLAVLESAKDAVKVSEMSSQLKVLSETVSTLVGEFKIQK